MNTHILLENTIATIDIICEKILQNAEYQQELQLCIQAMNDICPLLLQNNTTSQNTLQILKDMMYGITQQDTVFLLDVLRFGLKTQLETLYQTPQQGNTEVLYE